jgi:hypothetical protein
MVREIIIGHHFCYYWNVNVFIEFSTDHSLRCSVGSKGFRLAAAEKIHTVQSSMTMVQIQKFMLPIAELMTKVMLISLSLLAEDVLLASRADNILQQRTKGFTTPTRRIAQPASS